MDSAEKCGRPSLKEIWFSAAPVAGLSSYSVPPLLSRPRTQAPLMAVTPSSVPR